MPKFRNQCSNLGYYHYGSFNGLVFYISFVWADTHSMALGINPMCCILIFPFLRFLMIYQVTAAILFSNIPLLAVARYDSVACLDLITFLFTGFSSFCCCFSKEQVFSLLSISQMPVLRITPSFPLY